MGRGWWRAGRVSARTRGTSWDRAQSWCLLAVTVVMGVADPYVAVSQSSSSRSISNRHRGGGTVGRPILDQAELVVYNLDRHGSLISRWQPFSHRITGARWGKRIVSYDDIRDWLEAGACGSDGKPTMDRKSARNPDGTPTGLIGFLFAVHSQTGQGVRLAVPVRQAGRGSIPFAAQLGVGCCLVFPELSRQSRQRGVRVLLRGEPLDELVVSRPVISRLICSRASRMNRTQSNRFVLSLVAIVDLPRRANVDARIAQASLALALARVSREQRTAVVHFGNAPAEPRACLHL